MHAAAIEPSSPARYPDMLGRQFGRAVRRLPQRGDRRPRRRRGLRRLRRSCSSGSSVGASLAGHPDNLVGQRLGMRRPLGRHRVQRLHGRRLGGRGGVGRQLAVGAGPRRAARPARRPPAAVATNRRPPPWRRAAPSAAAPTSTRRLLTVGEGLGTCNILPLPARLRIRWTRPRVCRSPAAALAYRG